jgi:hypothetical protein
MPPLKELVCGRAIFEETSMRKFVMSFLLLAGILFGGALPASANVASGLSAKPAVTSEVAKAGWRHHGRHGGIFLGFGGYPYGGYPYYGRRYYNSYAYAPSYGYGYRRHHGRHWCGRHDRWEY